MPEAHPGAGALSAVRGEILDFVGDPAVQGDAAHRHHADGVLVLRAGRVAALGPAAQILATLPADAAVTDYRGKLIAAGIRRHAHALRADRRHRVARRAAARVA